MIGVDGGLPWHLPDELRRFKELTHGPRARDGAEDVRVDRTPAPGPNDRRRHADGPTGGPVRTACSSRTASPEAIAAAEALDDEVFVVGGAEVYAVALPLAARLVLTFVDAEPDGDTFFPDGRLGRVARDGAAAGRRVVAGRPTSGSRPAGSLIAMTDGGEVFTSEQMAALQAELAELEGPRRAAAIEAIATARGFGDLSENFEYHAAKNDQGLLEARIAKLRRRIAGAVVVDHDTDDHVGPGSIVEIADEQGEVHGGHDLVRRRRLPRLTARFRSDGRRCRRRRRRRGTTRLVAGDRSLDPPGMTPVSDFSPTPTFRLAAEVSD